MDQSSRESGTTGMATSTMAAGHQHDGGSEHQHDQSGCTSRAMTGTLRSVGEQARSAAASTSATAQEIARRAREQASAATDTVYQQGARAGEYMTRNIREYPAAALLIAGAVGYGLAYLIHGGGWSSLGRSKSDSRSKSEHPGG